MTTRDRALLRLVADAPTDEHAIAVYADWLEQTGELARAEFLRLQQRLRATRLAHPKLLERGRALHALGTTLPRRWVDAMTSPKLVGTTWAGTDDAGVFICRFLRGGKLGYTQPVGTYANGRWQQVGVTVAMDTNAHYADYFAVIVGDEMRGAGRNVVGHSWRWKLRHQPKPAKRA